MKTIKVRLAPSYSKYIPNRLGTNDRINYYHDDDYRIMQQLDMIIQTDSELLIQLLSKELNYTFGKNTRREKIPYEIWSLYRDDLVILDNIFVDPGNMASDKSEYCDPDKYEKYKSILVEWDNIDIKPFTTPTEEIKEEDIVFTFKVDNIYTHGFTYESECTSYDFVESIESEEYYNYFENMNSL